MSKKDFCIQYFSAFKLIKNKRIKRFNKLFINILFAFSIEKKISSATRFIIIKNLGVVKRTQKNRLGEMRNEANNFNRKNPNRNETTENAIFRGVNLL